MVQRSLVVTSGTKTQVKKVVLGRPVRRVIQATNTLNSAGDVDVTNAVDGSVLVYSESTSKWTATQDLENQNINGGTY
jgi:hypothetical protein